MNLRTVPLGIASLLGLLAFDCSAEPVFQVTGPVDFPAHAASPNEFGTFTYLYATWQQTLPYATVDISIPLASGVASDSIGAAYLTTSTGPGTTVADEVAHTTFTAHPGAPALTTLFSNLTLAPSAEYFLMIFANPGNAVDWAATNSPQVVLGQGVFLNQLESGVAAVPVNNSFAPYPPATAIVFGLQDWLLLDIEAVPEPSSFYMVVGALVGAAILKAATGRHAGRTAPFVRSSDSRS
jgi:hypothetical protein